jgi:glutamyl-tRNA reductase
MKLFVAGVSYRTAPVEVREQFAVTPSRLLEQTRRLQEESELDEVVLLSTCNRVELYGASRRGARLSDSLLTAVGCSEHDLRLHGYVIENDEAVRHLASLAASIRWCGETEITGQEDRV